MRLLYSSVRRHPRSCLHLPCVKSRQKSSLSDPGARHHLLTTILIPPRHEMSVARPRLHQLRTGPQGLAVALNARNASDRVSPPSSSFILRGSSLWTGVQRLHVEKRSANYWACRNDRRKFGSRIGTCCCVGSDISIFFCPPMPPQICCIAYADIFRRAKAKLLDGKGKPKPDSTPPRTPPELHQGFETDLNNLIHEDDGSHFPFVVYFNCCSHGILSFCGIW
jgi:hypothetical protein